MIVSMPPVDWNPSSDSPWPSWKTHTSTPSEAPRETTLMSSALIGTRIDPVSRNSSTNVARMTTAIAAGAWAASACGEVDQRRGLPGDPDRVVGPVVAHAARPRPSPPHCPGRGRS